MNKMVRKQIFVTAEQNKRLKARAAATGVSEAELVRAGIELRLEQKDKKPDWRRLAASFSSSWAERENLDEEMREIRGRWNRRDQLLGRQLLGRRSKRAK